MASHRLPVFDADGHVFEDDDHPGRFTEIFTCRNADEYEELEEKQDDRFRAYVAELERFTDLASARFVAWKQQV